MVRLARFILVAAILSVVAGVHIAWAEEDSPRRHPDAVEIFRCDFGAEHDIDVDRWPDHWKRRAGRRYPNYVRVEIADAPKARRERALRIDLDGGAAAVYSPPIRVGARFSYVAEGAVRTEGDPRDAAKRRAGLVNDVAFISVTFYDAEENELETFRSQQLRKAVDWSQLHIGPISPRHPETRTARIGLHLEPRGRPDLRGAALFDDLWFARLPRMTLTSNSRYNVYTNPDDIEITCTVSGILEKDPEMLFELIDLSSQQLSQSPDQPPGRIIATKTSRARSLQKEGMDGGDSSPQADNLGYTGTLKWRPPVPGFGFYWVRVTMKGSRGRMQERLMTLAVIRPSHGPRGGEYGWTLPEGDQPLTMKELSGLLPLVGVNWVKFPVWYDEGDEQRAGEIARFAERLSTAGIEMVAMLDTPPEEARARFGDNDMLLAASIFAEPELWRPVVDPVMTRLSLKVRWWQLGSDRDTSFVGDPLVMEKITDVRKQLERFGQRANIGIGWRWLYETPEEELPAWDFLAFTSQPPLTARELETYLGGPESAATKSTTARPVMKWVTLDPLSRSKYSLRTRTRDLVQRMLSAKITGAAGVFVPSPFDPQQGLMQPDGSPGELLLPWRTTSLMISGAKYVGSIAMPGGSRNYVFARGDEAVMVLWNETPTTETIYLGEAVEHVDLWHRRLEVGRAEHRQTFRVGPLPTFVTGVNLPVARMRMSFKFEKNQISSIFGKPQSAKFELGNFFPQGTGGRVHVITPDVWKTSPHPAEFEFQLAAGERWEENLRITLGLNASSGPQVVRADFEVSADRNYRFSAYRTIKVGAGDVKLEIGTSLNARGDLVVRQHLINETDQAVSFNCLLYAPGRRRLRHQIIKQPRGRSTRTFVLPRGEELIGSQLTLRAVEIGGERILNYRLDAQR